MKLEEFPERAEVNVSARHQKRRSQIAYLLRQHLTTAEIAMQIGKSEKIVRWHIERISNSRFLSIRPASFAEFGLERLDDEK